MRALKATVTILLDPRVIGPDAPTEWTGTMADASASDWLSEVLSGVNYDTVLDWGYEGDLETVWNEVEVDPETYEEGDMFAQCHPECGPITKRTEGMHAHTNEDGMCRHQDNDGH